MINKNFIRQSLIKSISIITTVSFLFTGVFSEIAYASINIEKTNFNKEEYNLNTFISSSIGRITSAKYYDSDEIIINIQDLHCHPETQKNIVKIIDQINKKYNLNEVYLEGAVGNVDTSLLSSLKKTELGNQIIESLLNLGRLSGAEYYSVVKDKNKFIVGIEDNVIYEENIQLLNQILSVYPDVSTICRQLDSEIKNVKKDYFNKDIRRLERLTYKFKKNKIDAKTYYGELEKIAKKVNEPLDKYGNVKLYVELLNKMKGINIEKISQQFKTYVTVLKSQIPYKQYAELSSMSNNFISMENISFELLSLSKQYGICDKYNLAQLNGYLECLEFNKNINPINFVKEEKNLISNIYVKLGKTKYEQEVAFLADFIPTIKDYFTANITTEDYYRFKEKFAEFRNIWNSYFSDNTAKELDRYAQMLSKYHENNLKRDKIFADILASSSASHGSMQIKDRDITDIIKNKKIKLIITGGFHSKGLEKIFDERKISYVVITPKVTHADSESNNIYLETIQEYVDILNDTVNIRPLDEEPLNISFPKILASAFIELNSNTSLSKEVKIQYINEIIKEVSQSNSFGSISLEKCSIDSLSSTDAKISVTYKDKSNNDMESTYEYLLDNSGTIQTYAQIDVTKALDMIDRYFGNIKYAMPSVILDLSKSARKKIGKTVIESLKSVSEDSISFMPVQKLHITVAYDSGSAMSETQIDEAVNAKDMTNAIFSDTEKLGKSLNSSKVSLGGKIKLMPDGAVILEITNEELVSQILGLRNILKKTDKYSFPKIVHMTLGRISDKELLDSGNVQSRQQLADLVSKLNDKIYEINKQNELSKIKSTLTLKGGYISATGDRDYLVVKAKPSSQILSILNNLFINTKSITYKVYTCFIAPIWEEAVFRFLPFIITTAIIGTPISIIPVIITGVTGTFIFSMSHMIVDKIRYGKTHKDEIRDWKQILFSSAVLTSVYIVISVVFPSMPLFVFGTAIILHSINNILALKEKVVNIPLLNILKDNNNEEKYLDKSVDNLILNIHEVISKIKKDSDDKIVGKVTSIAEELEKTKFLLKNEKKQIIETNIQELFQILVDEAKKDKKLGFNKSLYFDVNYLLNPLLKISIYLKDKNENNLFDSVFNFILNEMLTNTSSRFMYMTLGAAQYFYSNNEQKYAYKILDVLYKNKPLVKSLTDYGKFAIPLPSPFSYRTMEEWEEDIDKIIKNADDIYPVWYESEINFFLTTDKKYAYAILKSLYKNGRQKKPPYLDSRKQGYEWDKEFYTVCGNEEGIFIKERSVPLLTSGDIEFIGNLQILETNNIYLSDIISRMQYLKKEEYQDVIKTLKEALNLSREQQLNVVTEQMNKVYEIIFNNDDNIDVTTLELLAHVFAFIKKSNTKNTLLFDALQKIQQKLSQTGTSYTGFTAEKSSISIEYLVELVKYIYTVNREQGLDLIRFIYSDSKQREKDFGIAWSPLTVKDAYSKIPESLAQLITSYEDLELFYDAAGLPFDSIVEQSSIYDRNNYIPEYEKIFFRLPKSILESVNGLIKSKRYFRSLKNKKTYMTQSSMYFDALDKILENNVLALSEINNLNQDSIYDAIYFIEEMISSFEIINKEHGVQARAALENIKKDLKELKTTVEQQSKLKKWTDDKIDEIKQLHTLINAIHQTSIFDFMVLMKFSEKFGKKTMLKDGDIAKFYFYDCSENSLSNEIKDLIANLPGGIVSETIGISGKEENAKLIAKDNKLIWTKKLGAHSVDIFVDMNEGIKINFHDSDRGDGNALRVILLATLLSQAGFEITSIDTRVDKSMMDDSIPGTCEVKAVYSAPFDLNIGENYADLFTRAVNILGSTTNLDYSIENNDVDHGKHEYGKYEIPHLSLDDFKKIKNSNIMPEVFNLVPKLASEWNSRFSEMKRKMEEKKLKQNDSNKVYEYLNIKKEDRSYWTIARRFVEGKLYINPKNGELEEKKDYDGIRDLLKQININIDETLKQAQLINLLDYSKLYFETEGYIGGLIAVSGVLRLNNKGWLSIKGTVDKARRRMKCVFVEYVDFEGNRKILNYNELLDLLKDAGYSVKQQKTRSRSEKEATIKNLKENIIKSKEAIYIRGMGVSSGNQDGYTPVQITYDKDNVTENSMWVVSYTTPEDVETIMKAKGLITTGGGMLSHANITARENNKTAILSSGQWKNGKLEVVYYLIESGVQTQEGYQTQKISEHKLLLEEGDVILANGSTGRILLIRGISKTDINKIQKAIDSNDIKTIKKYLEEHKQDVTIGRMIEYIFLQTVWNEEKGMIIDLLLGWNEEDHIKEKVLDLNERYVEEKLESIKEDLQNMESIEDEKVTYGIIKRLEKEIETVKTTKNQKEIEDLKHKIHDKKNLIIIKLGKYVKRLEKEIETILSKKSITIEEKDKLTKISEMSKVWKYFYGYPGLEHKIEQIDALIRDEDGENYETEIMGFEKIGAKDILRYGSKTTELAKMTRLLEKNPLENAEIPYGIGISKDVMRIFFERAGKTEEFKRLMKDFEEVIRSGNKEKAIIIGQNIIKNIETTENNELKEYVENLLEKEKKYAVRSSGVGEDGGNHAFAGMAKTKLNIGKQDVYSSIKECWTSFYTSTCIGDMIKTGIVVKPALLIQEMVSGVEKAGVIFSRDERGNLTEEVVLGFGEGLVSGRINPDHITVRAKDEKIEYIRALDNMKKIVGKVEGGTRQVQLTREEKIERVIDEQMIRRLKKIAYALEEDAGYPVDVEFAIDKDEKIYILQRRAITTLTVDDKINYNEYKENIEIPQSLIDNLITKLEGITKYGNFTNIIIEVKEALKNLPANAEERYDIVSEQINKLFNIITASSSKQYYYKDTLFRYIAPISIFVEKQGTNELIFNFLLSMLLDNDGKEYDVITSAADMLKDMYTVSHDYSVKIIEFLYKNNFISQEKEISWPINNRLEEYKYDGLKLYYLSFADTKVIEKILSDILKDVSSQLQNIDFTDNLQIKTEINAISEEINFLSYRINRTTIPLLEYQINALLGVVGDILKDDRENAYKIINEILPVCKQISLIKQSEDSKILEKFYKIANTIYDINSDNIEFNKILSTLLDIAKNTDSTEENKTNQTVVKYLANIALHIYEPIAKNELEVDSQEYKLRKQQCFDIFMQIASKSPNNVEVYETLFNSTGLVISDIKGIGLSAETLRILITAANNSKKHNIKCSIPNEKFITYSPELVNMFINAYDSIDLASVFEQCYGNDDNDIFSLNTKRTGKIGRQIAIEIIQKLYEMAKDKSNSLKTRKNITLILTRIMAKGLYKTNHDDIPVDISEVKEIAQELQIPVYLYLGNLYIKNTEDLEEYNLTHLLKFLPDDVIQQFHFIQVGRWDRKDPQVIKSKNPVITKITGNTDIAKEEVKQLLDRFRLLQEILEYNVSVLTMLGKLKDSVTYAKTMEDLLYSLQQMINRLKEINLQHGVDAQIALDNIITSIQNKGNISENMIRQHLLLADWTQDNIREIKGIHTLINAIHQVSIADFKQEIGDVKNVGSDFIKTLTAKQESLIRAYNLSDKVNNNIIKFIAKLATKRFPNGKIDDFICKDDIVVWTTRLNAHSVDIFFNFGDIDRGISIYYRERPVSTGDIGKKERVKYFSIILERLGFNVEVDTQYINGEESYGLKAVLNKDFGLNDETDIIDIASKVVELFKFSTNVDYDLKYRHEQTGYEEVFSKLITKFMHGEMWYGVEINNVGWKPYGYGEYGRRLVDIPRKRNLNIESLNKILEYLGCTDIIPEEVTPEKLKDQKILDKYFNAPIERAYIEGRIIFNEQGILVKKDGYDITHSIIDEISNDITESSKQSRIINLVHSYKFKQRTLAYVGDLVAVSSVMELVNGNKLFVKGVMNPYTRRMKYAIVELVTETGHRKLTSDELISLLSEEGYDISNQEWVGNRERQMIKNLLERKIQVKDSPEVRCTSTSDGNGIYVAGNITFDRKNVKEDSILVVPYTIPDDIEAIKTSKGIITTGGGILSHAAITTREFKKPSVVVSGASWSDNEAEIQYFLSEGDVETVNGFQLQKVKAKNLLLQEGFRVLMNGETGTVLLFNDIDVNLLNELQDCINSNDERSIIKFMKKYEGNKDIRRLVEYVYFQSIGNSNLKQLLFALFSNEMPESVRSKIKELNQGYIQDKIRNITEGMENVKSIGNVNIAYGIIEMLSKKFELIKTTEKIDDLEKLKEEILSIEREIKDRLFVYLNLLISDARLYLEKEKLSINDIRKIINIVNTATVYDFFVPESEERADLKTMSRELKQLLVLLEIKTKGYLMKDEVVGVNKEITTFDGIHEEDVNKFGSKTTELAKMYRLLKNEKGVYVPEGMGVSIDVLELLFNLVGRDGDSKILKDFEKAVKDKDYASASAIAEKISSLIDEKDISPSRREFEDFLKSKISEFAVSGVKYSVRSSGVGEDGSSNAFAGMGETKLNVSAEHVYENIKECWKSFFSERCISYMIKSGQVVKPAVLIQEMVNVEKAGVVFSRNKYGNETIEVVYGLGEGLVSGALTPDTINVDINNGEIIEYSVADKQFKIVPTEDRTAKEAVQQGAKARALNAETVKRLTEIIRILEKDSGYPIDVEFGIKDGNIYILQRRAITTFDTSLKKNDKNKKSYSSKHSLKQLISVVSGDISKESDIFVNIANPENSDEAISIYLKSTENNRSIFYVDSKYSHLIKDGRIISLLVERINTDSVIREKFNSNLSIFDRVDNGEIGILPIIDILDNSILEKSIDINIENIKSILSAA